MIRSSLSLLIAATCIVVEAGDLQVEPDKGNVVASRLEGSWQVHESLTQRLTGNPKARPSKLSFTSDPSIAESVPAEYATAFNEKHMKVYLAGEAEIDGTKCPFVLTQVSGNPHVLVWFERDGNPFGNGESFNLMIAVASDTQDDLLFVGGDFNNQPFSAFERVGDSSNQ